MIAARAQRASYDQHTIIRLFLTGVTAYEGLGFSRGMVFLKSEEDDVLEGVAGIGEFERDKAQHRWDELNVERERLAKDGKDVLQTYLDRAEKLSAAIKAGKQQAPHISDAIRKQRIPLQDYRGALLDCLNENYRVVKYDEDDRFREMLAAMSGGTDRGSALLCMSVAFRERVLGVMIADNRFHPWERQTDFDEGVLRTYAHILAISLENQRLQKSAAFNEVFSEIGHDFNRQITRLSALISCLNYEINRAPYVSNMFWNSKAGDYLRQMVEQQKDLSRFTQDIQEFGFPIELDCTKIKLCEYVKQQILRFGFAAKFTIAYNSCQYDITVDIDVSLIGRAIDALLNNARQALLENEVSHPCVTVTADTETDSRGRLFSVVSIADNGPGVPADKKLKIFQPFFTTRNERGGNGLGLASARRYVEAHGGTLREVGKFGQGAVFVMKLPLSPGDVGREA